MNLKDEDGAIIIEATLSLSFFMFFIVTVLTIVNICYVQSKMSIAINETAKEISQYSYLYGLTGLNKKQQDLVKQGQEANDRMTDIVDNVGAMMDGVEKIKEDSVAGYQGLKENPLNTGMWKNTGQSIYQQIQSGQGNIKAIESQLKSIADDPVAFIKSLAALFGNEAINKASSYLIAAPVAKIMSKRHFKSSENEDCETFLKSLGVVPKGSSYLDGINFTKSELFADGENDIKIVAVYQVKVVPLLPINMQFTFCQTAETKGWFGE